jgi:hypothetical protein
MIDIVDRLRFDAARCEATFSKGVAGNIEDAISEIEHLRAALDPEAFERGRAAGKDEAALETKYGSFRAHVQAVISEARKVRDALEGDKLADGLGAALSAHDDFLAPGQ